jgi:hypothetical protein
MAGCKDCKHYNSTFGNKSNGFKTIRTCKLDKVDAMNKWWADNGQKSATGPLDDMECHEYSDLDKKLTSSLDKIDELLDKMNAKTQEWLDGKRIK